MADVVFFLRRLPIRAWTAVRITFLTIFCLLGFSSHNPKTTLPVFSLTSHGHRIRYSWMSISSVWFAGIPLSNIIIWLPLDSRVPRMLRLLEHKGLNVQMVPDLRSHTKWAYCREQAWIERFPGCVLVDDDLIYPMRSIQGLLRAVARNPAQVIVNFSAQIEFEGDTPVFSSDRKLAQGVGSENISMFNHPFSGSGMFIPLSVLRVVDSNPENFLAMCPTNDDIWLHREMFRLGFSIWSLDNSSEMPPSNPLMGGSGLHEINWEQGQNAIQLQKAFAGMPLPESL